MYIQFRLKKHIFLAILNSLMTIETFAHQLNGALQLVEIFTCNWESYAAVESLLSIKNQLIAKRIPTKWLQMNFGTSFTIAGMVFK